MSKRANNKFVQITLAKQLILLYQYGRLWDKHPETFEEVQRLTKREKGFEDYEEHYGRVALYPSLWISLHLSMLNREWRDYMNTETETDVYIKTLRKIIKSLEAA